MSRSFDLETSRTGIDSHSLAYTLASASDMDKGIFLYRMDSTSHPGKSARGHFAFDSKLRGLYTYGLRSYDDGQISRFAMGTQ
jgi:hypothetical protein